LPIAASRTSLRIEARRFYCSTPFCHRRTFAEPWPELVEPHARRTRRLGELQGRVVIACGGEGGASLLKHLRMPGSSEIAKRVGVSREGLYTSLSGGLMPSFETVIKVLTALGFRLTVARGVREQDAA